MFVCKIAKVSWNYFTYSNVGIKRSLFEVRDFYFFNIFLCFNFYLDLVLYLQLIKVMNALIIAAHCPEIQTCIVIVPNCICNMGPNLKISKLASTSGMHNSNFMAGQKSVAERFAGQIG